MAETEWYKGWFNSVYYHKLYFNRDEEEARAFISRLVHHLNPAPQSRMLDVACGRGRHSRFLADKGFDVTGIDISHDSILFAKEYETEHLHFYQHDMRLPSWINFFDYAFNFFTSFGYFDTRRENEDAVRTIAQSVKPGGVVLFDYLNVAYVANKLVAEEVKTIDDTTYTIQRRHDERAFYKRILVHDAALDTPIDYTEKVAKLTLADFTQMLEKQGAKIENVFGDYELREYDEVASPRLIVVGRKA